MSYHDLELRSAMLDGGRWRRSDESAGKDQEGIADPLEERMLGGPMPRPIMASRAARPMLFYLHSVVARGSAFTQS